MNNKKVNSILRDQFYRDKGQTERLFNKLSHYIYKVEHPETDLSSLSELIPKKYLDIIIEFFSDGDGIELPSLQEYQDTTLLIICYYLKELKNLTWKEIRDYLDLPDNYIDVFNPIIIGRKINKISREMSEMISDILRIDE